MAAAESLWGGSGLALLYLWVAAWGSSPICAQAVNQHADSEPAARDEKRANRGWAFSGETEKSGGRVSQRTCRANHNDSPKPVGENRIVRKCMA